MPASDERAPLEPAAPPSLLRRFFRPTLAGAGYLALLSLLSLASTLADERVQGVSAPVVRRLIATRFRGEVLDASLLALSTAIVLGLALGASAGLLLSLRDRLAGRPVRAAPRLAWPSLGVVAVTHALLWAFDLASHPQAYAPSLYGGGGVRALLQIAVCDVLGPTGVVAVAALAGLGFFAAPALRELRERRSRLWAAGGGAAVLVLLLGLSPELPGGLGVRAARAAGARPNVLVIAADSLRADRLEPRVAPELSRLAQKGTLFERAYVSLPRTFPSWMSILSGKDPHHHGIRHMFPRREPRSLDVGSIPRRFAAAGYHTAVVSDFAGDIFRRCDFGFGRAVTPTFNVRELVRETIVGGQSPILPLLRSRPARRLLPTLRELHDTTDARALSADALAEIDAAGGKPFFVVAFYSTTHFPYSAPAPHWSRFLDRSYRGPYRYGKSPAIFAEHQPGEADVKAVRALYDGAVSAVDEAAASLLAGLARRGLSESTIVVVTADHGECLYEPGRGQGHGDHLFGDEASRVPLLVVDPRRRGGHRIASVVRSVDIAPSLCELAAVECDADMDGRSLVPALEGKELPRRSAFAETGIWFTRQIPDVPPSLRLPYPDLTEVVEVDSGAGGELVARADLEPLLVTAKHRMVRDQRFKLVYAPTRSGVRWLLYDTEVDPLETRDVAREHPDVVERLSRELWQWMLLDRGMQREGDMLVPRGEAAR
ncbi:MAG: sulfatase [Myxococcales bacterium]|nr:sulfatase [Myxococcales bacterium]